MFKGTIARNEQRNLDPLQVERLGRYVYALQDPRDGKVFYVGQGQGNRVFDHLAEAQNALGSDRNVSSKVIRILDIWKNGEDVLWNIIAHGVPDESIDYVESSVIDALSISQNGQCLNEVSGPRSSMLTAGEVASLGATNINPEKYYPCVFIFPIHNALESSRENVYEATRASWCISGQYRIINSYAVGVKHGISLGGFKINSWNEFDGKYSFEGTEELSLVKFDWKYVISQALGFWQRGNYLIAEFDGNGKFRILRGGGENRDWKDCV